MRHDMEDDKLVELAQSIREVGLLQDLCVIPTDDKGKRIKLSPSTNALQNHEEHGGAYQVRAGHRRLLACRSINLESVTCKVFCDPSTSEVAIMAHENSFREEPSDYDLAVMYSEWLKEPGITENEVRRRAGKTLDFVYARAELLNGWEFVAMALHERQIPFSVARALNREADEPYAKMFLNMAIDQGATGKLVGAWVSEHKAHKDMTPQGGPAPDVGATVVVVPPSVPECLLCGERQSYMLRTVLLCAGDVDKIKAARAAVEADNAVPSVQGKTAGNR
jgi:ParB-like chromosome segregation protein Spo0J